MPSTLISAATILNAKPTTLIISLLLHRLDLAAIFGRRFEEPFPYGLGIGTGDVQIEARRLVHEVKERADMAKQPLRAGADRIRPGMEIDGAALGEEVAAARPGNAQRG